MAGAAAAAASDTLPNLFDDLGDLPSGGSLVGLDPESSAQGTAAPAATPNRPDADHSTRKRKKADSAPAAASAETDDAHPKRATGAPVRASADDSAAVSRVDYGEGITPFAVRMLRGQGKQQLDWEVTVPMPRDIQSLFRIVKDILPDVPLQVERSSDFEGFSLESIDPAQVCFVIARIACAVEVHTEDQKRLQFKVNAATASSCLAPGIVPPESVLKFRRFKGDEMVSCGAYVANNELEEVGFSLHTQMQSGADEDRPTLGDMNHQYTFEISREELCSLIKLAQTMKATEIGFSVLAPPSGGSGAAVEKEEPQYLFLKFSIIGENARISRTITSTMQPAPTEAGNDAHAGERFYDARQRGLVAIDGQMVNLLQEKFRGDFSTEYLQKFTSRMTQKMLQLSLSKDLPLVLRYPLGDKEEKGFIKFFLGAKIPEDDAGARSTTGPTDE